MPQARAANHRSTVPAVDLARFHPLNAGDVRGAGAGSMLPTQSTLQWIIPGVFLLGPAFGILDFFSETNS
jgi:hypothetical protein